MEQIVVNVDGQTFVGLRMSITISLGDGNFIKTEPYVSRPLKKDETIEEAFEDLFEHVEEQLNRGIDIAMKLKTS